MYPAHDSQLIMKFATVRVETTSERSGQTDKRPPIKTACTAQCETQRNTCFPRLFRRCRRCSGTGASWPQGALLPLRVPPSERELHHTTTRSTGLFILCVVCVGGSAGDDSAQRARCARKHDKHSETAASFFSALCVVVVDQVRDRFAPHRRVAQRTHQHTATSKQVSSALATNSIGRTPPIRKCYGA